MIALRLLGSIELRGPDGSEISAILRQPKRAALLAYLGAARPSRFHRRDELLAMFWPNADVDHARGALNQAVRYLRRHLQLAVLGRRGVDELGLDQAGFWCDAREFSSRLAAGDMAAAMALYRGDLLNGFHLSACRAFDRWLDQERRFLRQAAVNAAWRLAGLECSHANTDRAVAWGRTAAALGGDEAAGRRLIEFLHELGDRSGALCAYEDLVRTLREDFGIKPSKETRTLAELIRGRGAASTANVRSASAEPESASAVAGAPPADRRDRVIAVMPFDNLSEHPDAVQYLVDGLHEEVLAQISRTPPLRVISRTSVLAYRDRTVPVRRLADELGAGTILEGVARIAGEKLHLTVRLIDAHSDVCVWSATYDTAHSDLLGVQCDVAHHLAMVLGTQLTPQQHELIGRPRTRLRSAYNEVLLGRFFWNRFDQGSLSKAIEHFRRAIALDPGYADAYAGIAAAYAMLGIAHGELPGPIAFQQLKRYATRALSLDEQLADAHAWLGFHELYYGWDWSAVRRSLERALALNPSLAEAYRHLAFYQSWHRHHVEASANAVRAIELDPVSPITHGDAGVQCYYAGNYEEAVHHFQNSLELKPDFHPSHWGLGETYLAMGADLAALEHLEKAAEYSGKTAAFRGTLAFGYARVGRTAEARSILDELVAKSEENDELTAVIGTVYAGLQDVDAAFAWFNRAYMARCVYLPHFLTIPLLRSLEADARYRALRSRLGLARGSG